MCEKRMQMEIFSKFEAMIEKAVAHFIDLANDSIQSHDAFFVALSGGNTP
jgi:6-phosphogluconolactonase/glucosamine-6-phosphate isomerase/deaminase